MNEGNEGGGLDPENAARMLFNFHGQRALRIAAMRANRLAEGGDKVGALEWLRISEEVMKILQPGRPGN